MVKRLKKNTTASNIITHDTVGKEGKDENWWLDYEEVVGETFKSYWLKFTLLNKIHEMLLNAYSKN